MRSKDEVNLPKPEKGLVINYYYLWRDESNQGQEEGAKPRPCVISKLEKRDNRTIVFVFPITHIPQVKENRAIEIPPQTKDSLGLSGKPSWIITNECNYFEWPGFDLCTIHGTTPKKYVYGNLPPKIVNQIREAAKYHRTQFINRNETKDPRDLKKDIWKTIGKNSKSREKTDKGREP